jgi:hypothetical protein
MAHVRAAVCAMHLGARAPKAFINLHANCLSVQGIEKRRPAGAAVVFGFRVEKRFAAADAAVDARLLVVGIFAGEGSFRGFVARHIECKGLSAFFFEFGAPLVIGFLDFVGGHVGLFLVNKEKSSFRARKTRKLRESENQKEKYRRINMLPISWCQFCISFSVFFRVFRVTFASFATGSLEFKTQEEQEISIVEAQSGGKVA